MQLSGCILTKNNAKSIRYAIESMCNQVDEVVIIDSGSTDGTVEIAKEYTDRIFYNKFENFADQRNFGMKKCRGEWVFMLDADEMVGPKFSEIRKYLNKRYRSIALARYNIVKLEPLIYMTTKPHYQNWQTRCFRNDGKSYFWEEVHHKLGNYRPRLKCASIHYFHFDFFYNSYESRKAKVEYYNSILPGSGYPEAYLFEDYPYKTAECIEPLDEKLLMKLKQDENLLSYSVAPISKSEQLVQQFSYYYRSLILKLRTFFQI